MKIQFSNHLRVACFEIMGTGLMLLCLWFFGFEPDMVFIFTCFWLIYTIPGLYLHIEYTFRNTGEEIEINHDEVIVRKGAEKRRYSSSDLAKIIVYKSASLDRGGIQFTSVESYYYSRLIAKDGEEIIITCLMGRKVDEEVRKLSGVPYERKKRFFCTLSWK